MQRHPCSASISPASAGTVPVPSPQRAANPVPTAPHLRPKTHQNPRNNTFITLKPHEPTPQNTRRHQQRGGDARCQFLPASAATRVPAELLKFPRNITFYTFNSHAHRPKHQPNHLMLTNASPDPASQQPAASIALLKPAECFFFACFYPPGAINATAPRRTRHLPPEIPLRTVKKSTKITWPASCYYLFNWLSWVCQQVLQAVSFFQSRPESPSRPGLFFCGLLPWPGYYPLTDDKSAFEI